MRTLIAEVDRAGLTGRGGAGFPTADKLAAVAAGRAPVVIGNGTEGEPASPKDKVLMARSPHLVLDGAVCAEALPELITLDDWGFPSSAASLCPPQLPDARETARACPLVALRLERVNR